MLTCRTRLRSSNSSVLTDRLQSNIDSVTLADFHWNYRYEHVQYKGRATRVLSATADLVVALSLGGRSAVHAYRRRNTTTQTLSHESSLLRLSILVQLWTAASGDRIVEQSGAIRTDEWLALSFVVVVVSDMQRRLQTTIRKHEADRPHRAAGWCK